MIQKQRTALGGDFPPAYSPCSANRANALGATREYEVRRDFERTQP
ncbi:hypothetical protein [Alloactinosynnema sp. L-07]|nr:hypothetical protein [Alloactinosynnema sp. L-07]